MFPQCCRSLPHADRAADIAEISHGNPFYALELSRAEGTQLGHLEGKVRDVLLAAACVDPTVDLHAETTEPSSLCNSNARWVDTPAATSVRLGGG